VNEREAIVRAIQGDEAAWNHLVRQQGEPVFRLAYLLLGNADDAADVAQEVFLRAWRSLDRFDPARPLRPWLLEITRHQCSNWRRSVRRYLAALGRLGEGQPQVAAALDEQTTAAWQATALWAAVRRLRPSDQEVIYLRCFLELSNDETAAALGVAPGTVKSRLSRALARLRPLVAAELPAVGEEVVE
jgi:RNA polymerase sigma-70 factor (ECF subfamily)